MAALKRPVNQADFITSHWGFHTFTVFSLPQTGTSMAVTAVSFFPYYSFLFKTIVMVCLQFSVVSHASTKPENGCYRTLLIGPI